MVAYRVYRNIQCTDSDEWQYWYDTDTQGYCSTPEKCEELIKQRIDEEISRCNNADWITVLQSNLAPYSYGTNGKNTQIMPIYAYEEITIL